MHSQDRPPQTIESDDPRVTRDGTWLSQSAGGASGGTYLYSSGHDADVLTLPFSGTSIEVWYVAGPNLGTLALEVDGTVLRTVITTAAPAAYQQTTTLNYLTDEPHTLRVYAQAGGVVAVDAFVAWLPIDEEGGIQSAVPYDTQNQLVYKCIGGAYDGRLCTGYTATTRTPITAGTNYYAPRWSPDGNRVLYFAYPEPYPSAVGARYIIQDVSGSGGGMDFWPVNLSPHLGAGAWSPDGTRIVYSVEYDWDATGGMSGYALYIADLTNCSWTAFPETGCATTSLTEDMNNTTGDGGPDWSPDGSLIAFIRSSTSGYLAPTQLYTIHPNGTGLAPINYNGFIPAGIKLTGGQWSPDGTRFLVAGINLSAPYNSALYILNLAINSGGATVTSVQQVTTPTSSQTDGGFTWSRDGSQIAFTRSNWVCSPACVTSNTNIRITTYNAATSTWTIDPTVAISGGSPSWRWQAASPYCIVVVNDGVYGGGTNYGSVSINGYTDPVDARTARFEATPTNAPATQQAPFNGPFTGGTYLRLEQRYDRSGGERYIYLVTDYRPAGQQWQQGTLGTNVPDVWISEHGVRGFNPNNYYPAVLEVGGPGTVSCETLPSYQPNLVNPTFTIELIRDYGVDVRSCGLAWTQTELDEIHLGLVRTGQGFERIGVTGQNNFERFQNVMFTNAIFMSDVPDFMILERISAVPPNITCDPTEFALNYDENDTGDDGIKNGVCRTFHGSNTTTAGVTHATATPAEIACRGGVSVTQHTVVHELGHRFDNRTGFTDPGGLSYRIQNNLTDYGINIPNGHRDGNGVMRDCSRFLNPNIAISDVPVVMGILNDDWKRGRRGWGTWSDDIIDSNGVVTGRRITQFQQHPAIDPEPEVDQVSEASADMFLNWVYRLTSDATVPSTTPDEACTSPVGNGTQWEGFQNLSGNNTYDDGRSGNRRYWWMHNTMRDLLNLD